MGYYTEHELTVKTGEHTVAAIAKAIAADRDTFYGLEKPWEDLLENECPGEFSLECSDAVKWYSEAQDMMAFSERFPTATFIIHGEGEERNDTWEHEYKAGAMRSRSQVSSWADWGPWGKGKVSADHEYL